MVTKMITISETVDRFLETARVDHTLNGESVAKYRASIFSFARTMGDLPVSEVSSDTFHEFKRRMQERRAGASSSDSPGRTNR